MLYLAEVVRKKIEIPFPALKAIVDEAGARPDMSETELVKLLQPHSARILKETYALLVARCRALGIAPIWIFLPQVTDGPWAKDTPEAERLAAESGMAVLSLADVFRGHEPEKLRLEEWDEHPNAFAHRLLAERLHAELMVRGSTLFKGAAP